MEGVLELTPVEDVSLQSGTAAALGTTPATQEVVHEDGSVTTEPVTPTNVCPHNAEFFANPDYENILNAQRIEMQQRAADAAAAAAAAAQEAAAQAQPETPQ